MARLLLGAKCGSSDKKNICQTLKKILENRKMYIHT